MTNTSGFGSDDFTFSAQTLADHPYAGRRSWRLTKLNQADARADAHGISGTTNGVLWTVEGVEVTLYGYYSGDIDPLSQDRRSQYMAETVEFNTFPWLIDYTGEISTSFGVQNGRESARLNWERFLRRIVSTVGGSIEDSSLLNGYTIYNKADLIKSDSLAQYTLSEYSDIADEFSLISSLPSSQGKDSIFIWKQLAGPKVDLKDSGNDKGTDRTFIVPQVGADNTKLTFEFAVTDKIRTTTHRLDIIVDKANHKIFNGLVDLLNL